MIANKLISPARKSGFSLVEVTLALAIIAFGVVSVAGLLPIGLNVHRQSIDLTVSTQIVQRVTSDVSQADANSLGLSSGGQVTLPTRYFDEQGNELLDPAGYPDSAAASRVYDVQTVLTAPANVLGSSVHSMTRVQIQIAHNPGRQVDVFDPARKLSSTYFAIVTRRS